jgi:DNA (cytosine-5)-methyltransferase 1
VRRPRLLDLYCGAGGAGWGYHLAGFDVFGIDILPQPKYPLEFAQGDVLEMSPAVLQGFDAVHASPPCLPFTAYGRRGGGVGEGVPNLLPQTRKLLQASGVPYVIENVPGARKHLRDPLMLCASHFVPTANPSGHGRIRRHRLFECSFPIWPPAKCRHKIWPADLPGATNRKANSRLVVAVGEYRIPLEVQKRAMGVPWDCTREELSKMIPPMYTEYIGKRLLEVIGR